MGYTNHIKSDKIGKERLLRFLLMLELIVTIMIMMNLSESLERYVGAAGSMNIGSYIHEINYDISSDLLRMPLDEQDNDSILEAYKELDKLLTKLEEFPVNTYFYVGGAVGNAAWKDFCVYMSMNEPPPYPFESGKYDDSEEGIYLGNGCLMYMENGKVQVFDEWFPVIGIMSGSGFDRNELIAVKYSDLTDGSKEQVKGTIGVYITKTVSARLCIGSDKNDIRNYADQLEKIFAEFSHLSAERAYDEWELDESISDRYSSIKTFLVVLSFALCIFSNIQVAGMYISCKKKEIVIRCAFGLSKRTVFFQIIKEMSASAVSGTLIAVVLEIIIYIAVLRYNAALVFRYGIFALVASLVLYMLMLAVAFMRVMQKGITAQLGKA